MYILFVYIKEISYIYHRKKHEINIQKWRQQHPQQSPFLERKSDSFAT